MSERAEPASVLGEGVVARLVAELRAALKRKPTREALLGGAVGSLLAHSPELRREVIATFEVLVRRRSFERPLYCVIARALAEARDARAAPLLARALEAEDGGGFATLGAAGFSDHPALAEPLVALSVNRHAHVAFAAEVARVARGESNGAHGTAIAPMIKEAHRITLCEEVLVAWAWRRGLPPGLTTALSALRGAERHLGRWLLLAELGARAGDPSALADAKREAATGSAGTRPAWALVSWALDAPGAEPAVRPTLELVTRLSDRPTADKDASFLYRLSSAQVASVRPLLRHLTRGPLDGETGVRAALHLARDFEDARARTQLIDAVSGPRHEGLRGFAAAALYDLGEHAVALRAARELADSKHLATLTFASLVLAGASGKEQGPLLTEPRVRRIQLGWGP
jgi:hypothetical protein